MDVIRKKAIITDRNPYLEGLGDIHRCIYLPSAYEKSKAVTQLENSAQVSTLGYRIIVMGGKLMTCCILRVCTYLFCKDITISDNL